MQAARELLLELALFGLIHVAPRILMATPPGLLFGSAVALSSTVMTSIQIIETPSTDEGLAKTLYNFNSTRGAYFGLLTQTGADIPAGFSKGVKLSNNIFAAFDGLVLLNRAWGLANRYVNVNNLQQDFNALKTERAKTTADLDAMLAGENFTDFLLEALAQQSGVLNALQTVYLGASFSACQTLPSRGLKSYANDRFGPVNPPYPIRLP